MTSLAEDNNVVRCAQTVPRDISPSRWRVAVDLQQDILLILAILSTQVVTPPIGSERQCDEDLD